MVEDACRDNDEEDIAAGEEILFGLNFAAIGGGSCNFEDVSDSGHTSIVPAADSLLCSVVRGLCGYHEGENSIAVTEADFTKLFEWASHQGAALEGMECRTDSYGGRGLFATQKFQMDGVIAMLPRSLRWGQSHACQLLALPKSTPDLTALTLLILHLRRENHVYARCLPRQEHFTNAMLMSKDAEASWGRIGQSYVHAIRRVRSIAEGCQGYIRRVILEEDDDGALGAPFSPILLWAIAIVKSRTHAFGSKRGYWLTPVLDLVNHSQKPNAALIGGDQGQLLLQALRPIADGEEITIDYQVDDDSMLVANYGFSLIHITSTSSNPSTTCS